MEKLFNQHFPSNNLDGDTYLIHRLAAIKLIRELEMEGSLSDSVDGDTYLLHRLAAIKQIMLDMEASALDNEYGEAGKSLKNEIIEIACQNGIFIKDFINLP